MGKLTEAFNKLDAGRKSFVADVDHWQSEVTKRWAAVSAYQKAMSQLMIVDDKVLNQIGDAKARSAKAVELADARGKSWRPLIRWALVIPMARKKKPSPTVKRLEN